MNFLNYENPVVQEVKKLVEEGRLGRVTIGKDAVIGANIWLMEDVAPGTQVVQRKKQKSEI